MTTPLIERLLLHSKEARFQGYEGYAALLEDAAEAMTERPITSDRVIPPVPYDEHEREILQIIDERDRYHEAADALATRLGSLLGIDIGEHSSGNDPWQTALDAADAASDDANALTEQAMGEISATAPDLVQQCSKCNFTMSGLRHCQNCTDGFADFAASASRSKEMNAPLVRRLQTYAEIVADNADIPSNRFLSELLTEAASTLKSVGEPIPVAQVRRSSEGPHGVLYAGLIPVGPATQEVKEGDLLFLRRTNAGEPETDYGVRDLIDDEMIQRALGAWYGPEDAGPHHEPWQIRQMRAALASAIHGAGARGGSA